MLGARIVARTVDEIIAFLVGQNDAWHEAHQATARALLVQCESYIAYAAGYISAYSAQANSKYSSVEA
eukprot:5875925-Pyramimonas_sp.AAC.1